MELFADTTLSQRLESLAAEELRRFVETSRQLDAASDAASIEVAGGVAVYLGANSPVNQATGLGFDGPVAEEDFSAIEYFYRSRGQRGLVIASPLADPSLATGLSARGWGVDSFENVLVRPYECTDSFGGPAGVTVAIVDDDEMRALWAHAAAVAFAAPLDPMPVQLELGRIVAARPGARLLLAFVEGKVAGTGELFVDDGVAWLSADATLPQFRRRGVQQALQAARLTLGAYEGCEMAVTEAVPGSPSQRNMERAGFRVAYTRVGLLAPMPPISARPEALEDRS